MGKNERKTFTEEKRQYYTTIKEKPTLYIEVSRIEKPMIYLTVKNMLVLFLLDTYHLHKLFDIKFVFVTSTDIKKCRNGSEEHVVNDEDHLINNDVTNFVKYESEYYFQDDEQVISIIKDSNNKIETNNTTTTINISLSTNDNNGTIENHLDHKNQEEQKKLESEVWNCKNPSIYIHDKKLHIAGLGAVLRFIILFATRNDPVIREDEPMDAEKNKLREFPEIPYNILGYHENCLAACAETSLWTKFCEHDTVKMVGSCQKQLLELVKATTTTDTTITTAPQKSITATDDTGILVNLDSVQSQNTPTQVQQQQIQGVLKIPKDLVRLENHLSLPCKIHNFQKKKREQPAENNQSLEKNQQNETNNGHEKKQKENRKKRTKNEKRNSTMVKQEDGKVEKEQKKRVRIDKRPREVPHDYAQGTDLTLTDLIFLPCIDIVLSVIGNEWITYLPLVYKYHQRLSKIFPLRPKVWFQAEELSSLKLFPILSNIQISVPEIQCLSLYHSDPERTNPISSILTKQYEIEEALNFLSQKGIEMLSLDDEQESPFDWSSLPNLLHPEGGQLPFARIEKKAHQLSNLVQRVEKVYYDKYASVSSKKIKIVDFCSGGGHLGILLAYVLPKCEIILVDNKQESLKRAEQRVKLLGLKNVTLYQCNLDYFTGLFDIGVSLHACGTATDMVVTRCIQIRASFVCSPCCYGSNRENHILEYPRSSIFSNAINNSEGLFSLKHYFVLCHASDQTTGNEHGKSNQGKMCMRLIDTDRCLHAQENNYQTFMAIMEPPTCSPKNHIIFGIPN